MDNDYASEPLGAARPERRRRWPWSLVAVLLALVLGGAASLWVATETGWVTWRGSGAARQAATNPPVATTSQPLASTPMTEEQGALSLRLAELEQRFARLNIQTLAAEENAARAEGLMIAFAVRRAIERGQPLGFLEAQLKARFGDAQPNAVATLIEAGSQPVTRESLQEQLVSLAPMLASPPADSESTWQRIERELAGLFVIRRETTPSPLPQRRRERAESFVAMGRVDAAIAEVERLPGRGYARDWLAMARRYVRAQRALDLIETAALIEPRAAAVAPVPIAAPVPAPAMPAEESEPAPVGQPPLG